MIDGVYNGAADVGGNVPVGSWVCSYQCNSCRYNNSNNNTKCIYITCIHTPMNAYLLRYGRFCIDNLNSKPILKNLFVYSVLILHYNHFIYCYLNPVIILFKEEVCCFNWICLRNHFQFSDMILVV